MFDYFRIYRDFMIFATVMGIFYVLGFVFLYGVIRLGVRHGVEDADARRQLALEALERRETVDPEGYPVG